MEYKNTPKIVNDPAVDALRDVSARRAATISNMIDEAKKRGLDDQFARDAIYKYGQDNGKDMLDQITDPADLQEFSSHFASDMSRKLYEMETVACDDEKFYIDFHYCPYVTEWLKQGRTPEEIENLCDIAMEGDRAVGDTFSAFKFKLGGTIAQGCEVCQLRFDKVK